MPWKTAMVLLSGHWLAFTSERFIKTVRKKEKEPKNGTETIFQEFGR